MGVAVTDRFQIIFDTVSDSRKHQNLLRDTRIAATLSGPGEQTLQVEGGAIQSALRQCPMRSIGKRTIRHGQTDENVGAGQKSPIGALSRIGLVIQTMSEGR